MARIAIVTDSTADLDPETRLRYDITSVPLNVHFGTEVYRDQVDLTSDEFMLRLQQPGPLPTTSQPSPGIFEEAFRALAADHDAIVAVLISSKLSGTVQSATLAAAAVAEQIPVEIVDSLNASLGLGFQAIRAAELSAQGIPAPDIAMRLRAETSEYHLVFFVDTLEFLQRGGRIGRAASLVGTFLKLKPVLRVDEGQVVPYERTRTRAKAIEALKDFVSGLPKTSRLGFLYSTSRSDVDTLAAALADRVPPERVTFAQFSPVIGTHVGPGAVGICVYEGAAD